MKEGERRSCKWLAGKKLTVKDTEFLRLCETGFSMYKEVVGDNMA